MVLGFLGLFKTSDSFIFWNVTQLVYGSMPDGVCFILDHDVELF